MKAQTATESSLCLRGCVCIILWILEAGPRTPAQYLLLVTHLQRPVVAMKASVILFLLPLCSSKQSRDFHRYSQHQQYVSD